MKKTGNLSFDPRGTVQVGGKEYTIFRLDALEREGLCVIDRMPYTIRLFLGNLLRNAVTGVVTEEEIRALAGWAPKQNNTVSLPFMPSRVILQDFTGVPALVDLAAMRSAMARVGADPVAFEALVRLDSAAELEYYRHGGILQKILREMKG